MKLSDQKYQYVIFLYLALGLLVLSCDESEDKAQADGLLNVILVDAPASYQQVKVDIENVSIHHLGSAADVGWSTVSTDAVRDVNLLSLRNGKFCQLVLNKVTAGKYDKIRVLFGPSSVTEDGNTTAFEYSSVFQFGYTQSYNFEISGEQQCELAIDIDVYRSISKSGASYYFNPVLRIQDVRLTGWIVGTVVDTNKHPVYATISTALLNDLITTQNDTMANGAFKLSGLPANIYSVTVVPFDTSSYSKVTVDNVAVNQKETKDIGQFVLRK